MAGTSSTSGERMGFGMAHNIGRGPLPFKSPTRLSAYQRLGMRWGCRDSTAKDRIYGERGIYQMVADANSILLAEGYGERVAALMSVVEASLIPPDAPTLADCVHAHNQTDATEDLAQAEYLRNSTDEALAAWKRKLAHDLSCGERLLAAMVREETRRAETRGEK